MSAAGSTSSFSCSLLFSVNISTLWSHLKELLHFVVVWCVWNPCTVIFFTSLDDCKHHLAIVSPYPQAEGHGHCLQVEIYAFSSPHGPFVCNKNLLECNWSLELWLQRETRTKNLVSSPSVYEYTSFSSEVITMIQYHVTDYSERQCTLSCACNSTNVHLWAERENYSSYVFVLDGVWTEGRH